MDRHTRRGALSPLTSALGVVLVAGLVTGLWSTYQLRPWAGYPAADAAESGIPWSDVNPVGVNTFLSGEVESWKRERTMAMVAESGAGWIRQGFAWNEIEPEKGEHWDAKYQQDSWAKFDEIVALAEENGVRIIARLDQTPAWARGPGTTPATPPENPEDFGDFIYEFVSRYRGRISFIQIWNEPNLAREWGGTVDPAGYATLLDVAARRAREADPNVVILSAPMAMTTENSDRATDEFTYWQALYDLGVADSFDIMSANVYGLDESFDAEPDHAELNVRRVELLRELAVRNGDGEKAIWFNEYGWNASPADFPDEELIWSRVDESRQAEWTARGIEYAEEHWDWFGVANIWYFRQVGNISPDRSDYYFRMVDLEFTPRDVYRSVQALSRETNAADMGTHGMLGAPVTARGSWGLVQDASARSGYYLVGDENETLEIRFTGSALDIHIVPHHSGGEITVSIYDGDASTPENARGTTFTLAPDQRVLTVSGSAIEHPSDSAPKVRTAIITVQPGSQLSVEGYTVRYERSYKNVVAGGLVAAAALAGMVGLRRQSSNQR